MLKPAYSFCSVSLLIISKSPDSSSLTLSIDAKEKEKTKNAFHSLHKIKSNCNQEKLHFSQCLYANLLEHIE